MCGQTWEYIFSMNEDWKDAQLGGLCFSLVYFWTLVFLLKIEGSYFQTVFLKSWSLLELVELWFLYISCNNNPWAPEFQVSVIFCYNQLSNGCDWHQNIYLFGVFVIILGIFYVCAPAKPWKMMEAEWVWAARVKGCLGTKECLCSGLQTTGS